MSNNQTTKIASSFNSPSHGNSIIIDDESLQNGFKYDKIPHKKHQNHSNPVIPQRKINDKTKKVLNFDEILSDWDDCDSCEFDYEAD